MPIGSQISSPLPTAGDTGWSADVNTLLQEIIDAIETRVTVDGMNVSGTLDVQGATLTNIGLLKMILKSDPGTARTLWVTDAGELAFRDGANNLITLTATGSINVGTIAGIGGDYSSSGASITYDSASGVYQFLMHTGDAGRLNVGDIRIRQGSDANYIALKAPASLAGDYNINLPAAAPSGLAYLQMDATGTLGYAPSHYPVTATLDCIGNSVGVTGAPSFSPETVGWSLSAGEVVGFTIPYNHGDRIDSVSAFVEHAGSNSCSTTASLYHRGGTTSAATKSLIAQKTWNGSADDGYKSLQSGETTMTGTMPYTPPGTGSLYLLVQQGNGGDTAYVNRVRICYMRRVTGSL